jgi:actin related protein 2/3 complex subunit 1A/1B
MSYEPRQIAASVSCHAWNGDKTKFAFSPNNHEIHVLGKQGAEWELEHVLKEHDEAQRVTGIDWAPQTNRIVTCSQDRNAYVWKFEANTWKPTLVILRISRAATAVKWSPKENKFAVASGAKAVSVCYFENDNDWWVSKHIKKHKSTVLGLDWHPNNVLLATASSDFKTRVFAAAIKGIDTRVDNTPYGTKLVFGEILGEYSAVGWVHAIKWSPSGNQLAYVSHDSAISVINVANGAPGEIQTVKFADLPLLDLLWVDESRIAGVGHDRTPFLFEVNAEGWWSFSRKLEGKGGAPQKAAGGQQSAFNIFKNKVETGQSTNITTLDSIHQNSVNSIQAFASAGGRVTEFTSTGLDGRIVHWKV